MESVSMSYPGRQIPPKRRHKTAKYVVYLLIVIIIAAMAAIGLQGNGYLNLSSERAVQVSQSPVLVDMHGVYFSISLALHSGNEAVFYVSKLPIFTSDTMLVKANLGNTTHIGFGTQYASLGIRLNSLSANVANVTLIPIDPALGVAIDYAEVQYKSMLPGAQNSSSGIKIIITNESANATGTNAKSTTPTTTIAATTTVKASQPSNDTKVMQALESSIWYPLMLNYSSAYSNTTACSSTLYNSSYKAYYGTSPSGPATYQNQSALVPYKLNGSISSTKSPYLYFYTYYTYSHSPHTTGKALSIEVNISSMTTENITLSGVFLDSNYTALYKGYEDSLKVGNACGIEVV
ncbi:MAG: hypothetical protein ACP5NE_03560 [Candidatus Micrarchaeia archaeon]